MKGHELMTGDIAGLLLGSGVSWPGLVLGEGRGVKVGCVVGLAGDKHMLFLDDMRYGFIYASDRVELIVRAK